MSKVTVITVSYNSATTIAETLRSVARQTHPEIEHVVIDGASTDATLATVREWGSHLSALSSEPDRGIYDAMNKGVRQTRGDVVGFLNADDHYAHDAVLAHVAAAFADPGVDAVMGDVAFFRPDRPDHVVRRYRADKFAPKHLAWGWMPPHPALFVRRGVFERVGPFRTDFRIAGDYEWIVRAFGPGGIGRYTYLPATMVHMLTGGISNGGWRSTLLLNQEVLRACRDNGLATSWPKLLLKYPAKALEFLRP
jgi:glycosyltransferase involved in cell wall biosynthesis